MRGAFGSMGLYLGGLRNWPSGWKQWGIMVGYLRGPVGTLPHSSILLFLYELTMPFMMK